MKRIWRIIMSSRGLFLIGTVLFVLGFFTAGGREISLQLFFNSRHTASVGASGNLREAQTHCSQESDRTKIILCVKKHIERSVQKWGVDVFMASLKELFSDDQGGGQGNISHCHDIAHAIGQIAGADSDDLNTTIQGCTDICTFGCYHGVVEGYIASGKNFISQIPDLCVSSNRTRAQPNLSACFHGIGHGAASIAGFNLKKSFSLCDLIQNADDRKNCGAGVIMELYEPSSFNPAPLTFPPDIPKFCALLENPYQEVCYDTAGIHAYARSQDIKDAVLVCMSVPQSLRRDCISALGQNLFFVFNGATATLVLQCAYAQAEYESACIAGALEASITADPVARHAKEICDALEQRKRSACYALLGKKAESLYGWEARKNICAVFSNTYQSICADGK